MQVGTLQLYYAPGACSLAPHLVLEELGQPFELKLVDFRRSQQKTAAYLGLNPKGRVPVLVHGELVLTETPALLRYLARLKPEADLWPEDLLGDARCTELLAWIASSVHATYSHVTRPERYVDGAPAQDLVRAKNKIVTMSNWSAIDARLTQCEWMLGSKISVADFYVLVVWVWARGSGLYADIIEQLPNWSRHSVELARRPSVQRALAQEKIELPIVDPSTASLS